MASKSAASVHASSTIPDTVPGESGVAGESTGKVVGLVLVSNVSEKYQKIPFGFFIYHLVLPLPAH
jgi:hypothetical protein